VWNKSLNKVNSYEQRMVVFLKGLEVYNRVTKSSVSVRMEIERFFCLQPQSWSHDIFALAFSLIIKLPNLAPTHRNYCYLKILNDDLEHIPLCT
jgi:hypothetical protein